MTNNVGLTFSVGDTPPRFTIWERARQLESVTLSIIFSVAFTNRSPGNGYRDMICGQFNTKTGTSREDESDDGDDDVDGDFVVINTLEAAVGVEMCI